MPSSKNKEQIPLKWLLQLQELFVPYGFRSPSMDDISSHLGISKKTLYRHVSNKEDLLIVYIDWRISCIKNELISLKEEGLGSPLELAKMIRIISSFLLDCNQKSISDLEKFYPRALSRFLEYRNQELMKIITQVHKKGMKEGLFHQQVIPKFSANILLLSLENIANNQLSNVQNQSTKSLVEQLVHYHLSAIKKRE